MKCWSAWYPWRNCHSRVIVLGKVNDDEESTSKEDLDRDIQDHWFKDTQHIYLIIPGNPGPAEFYEPFMESLASSLRQGSLGSDQEINMCAVSHAGHDTKHRRLLPTGETYKFEEQIEHKIDFIKQYIPQNTRLTLIGHSIGCKVIMEIFKRLDTHTISGVYFLFPTIENMLTTPRGVEVAPLTSHLRIPLIAALTLILSILPKCLLGFLIRRVLSDCPDQIHRAVMSLANSNHVNNSLVMAADELVLVKDLDTDTIQKMVGKLRVYYGLKDGWCPLTYRDNLLKVEGMTEEYAIVDNTDMEHAFVLRSGHHLGKLISDWILKGQIQQ